MVTRGPSRAAVETSEAASRVVEPERWIKKVHPPRETLSFGSAGSTAPKSIVVLARDEERCMARCLDSVIGRGFDDILVVDTGSTDATLDIVARYRESGVRLAQTPWPDSFADVRNFAIRGVRAGWIVFVDADEWLDAGSAERLSRCLDELSSIEDLSQTAFAPTISDVGRASYVDDVPRIFRTDTRIRYRGQVHEYPVVEGPADAPIDLVSIDIDFLHDGYDPAVLRQKNKERRNRALLDAARESDPFNPRWLYFAVRDGLAVLDGAEIVGLCNGLARLADQETRPGSADRADSGTYYRRALVLACYGLVARREWSSVEQFCAELDRLDHGASADSAFFCSMVTILTECVTDRGLQQMIKIRKDEDRLAKSTICTRGRHLDAILAVLLEQRRGKTIADRYRELCLPWTDAFFQDSKLRTLRTRGR
jgi:glycosyltransferase involved in cell wall biosynthesis